MKKILVLAVASLTAIGLLAGCGAQEFALGNNITVVSREDGSGTRGAFIELTGVEEKDADGNKVDNTTDEAIVVSKTGVVLSNVASDINAIGYVSMGSLNDTVKTLTVDGVAATVENVKNDTYSIKRPFNIAYKGELNEIANDFVKYILSTEGQAVVEDEGYIQINDASEGYTTSNLSGKIVVAGSSSVAPVMEVLAEEYMAINPDVNVEIQVSDSSTGMQNTIDGTCDIGMASRDLKDEEKTELKNIEIALDGIAIIVNNENTLTNITLDMIKNIYTGKVTTWEEE